MRTVAYVDGYNLYYGRLRGTPYKWLNLRKLLEKILHEQNPATDLQRVVFCSAGILARFAKHGTTSVEAQARYHRALSAVQVDVVLGRHETFSESRPNADKGTLIDPSSQSRVWMLEEKETDVRLALGMYRDAVSGLYDQAVLVTSDTDLVPALEAIRQDAPHVNLGVVMPRSPSAKRPQSRSLSKLAAWTRSHIHDAELEASLFPENIHRPGRKSLKKPPHW